MVSGIFAVIGITISVIIIALGGGFSAQGPSIINPPTEKDLWTPGDGLSEGMQLDYLVSSIGSKSILKNAQVSITFRQNPENWNVNFNILNGTDPKNFNVTLSDRLTLEGQTDINTRLYFEPIERSVLVIRDIAREPKYLVVGARWDTISLGLQSIPIQITSKENIKTTAGEFESFVLSYKIGQKENKIWISKEVPLPVRAQVYDSEERLLYNYEITAIRR